MGAQSDFISEQFVPSERHKAQQRRMAETLSAAGLNPREFDSLSTPEETVRVARRNLRIVQEHPLLGVCEYCSTQFPADKGDVQKQFEAHECKRQGFAQNAAQIVREARKD